MPTKIKVTLLCLVFLLSLSSCKLDKKEKSIPFKMTITGDLWTEGETLVFDVNSKGILNITIDSVAVNSGDEIKDNEEQVYTEKLSLSAKEVEKINELILDIKEGSFHIDDAELFTDIPCIYLNVNDKEYSDLFVGFKSFFSKHDYSQVTKLQSLAYTLLDMCKKNTNTKQKLYYYAIKEPKKYYSHVDIHNVYIAIGICFLYFSIVVFAVISTKRRNTRERTRERTRETGDGSLS